MINLKAVSTIPRITIITPSYNQGAYIEDTILSVLNQDYPNLEYIIIDGGSNDQTIDIIKKYSDRISYWVSEKDRGQSHAINKGFERATGEIINWINSDDQLMPDTLHKLAAAFTADPELMMLHGRIEYFGETKPYYSVNLPAKDLDTRYVSHICMPQPATFYDDACSSNRGCWMKPYTSPWIQIFLYAPVCIIRSGRPVRFFPASACMRPVNRSAPLIKIF